MGKLKANEEWKKATKLAAPADIIAAVMAQKTGAAWMKDGGQYIPNPATWLHQGRWEDEIEVYRPPPPAGERLTASEQLQRRNEEALRRAMEE